MTTGSDDPSATDASVPGPGRARGFSRRGLIAGGAGAAAGAAVGAGVTAALTGRTRGGAEGAEPVAKACPAFPFAVCPALPCCLLSSAALLGAGAADGATDAGACAGVPCRRPTLLCRVITGPVATERASAAAADMGLAAARASRRSAGAVSRAGSLGTCSADAWGSVADNWD